MMKSGSGSMLKIYPSVWFNYNQCKKKCRVCSGLNKFGRQVKFFLIFIFQPKLNIFCELLTLRKQSRRWFSHDSLYFGADKRAMACLQKIQNAAARMLKSAKKFESVTPLLKSLKWMPVRYRISYKILLLVFKALHNFASSYLSSVSAFYNPSRLLRSENQTLLCVVRTKHKQKGNRSFSCVGPKL